MVAEAARLIKEAYAVAEEAHRIAEACNCGGGASNCIDTRSHGGGALGQQTGGCGSDPVSRASGRHLATTPPHTPARLIYSAGVFAGESKLIQIIVNNFTLLTGYHLTRIHQVFALSTRRSRNNQQRAWAHALVRD